MGVLGPGVIARTVLGLPRPESDDSGLPGGYSGPEVTILGLPEAILDQKMVILGFPELFWARKWSFWASLRLPGPEVVILGFLEASWARKWSFWASRSPKVTILGFPEPESDDSGLPGPGSGQKAGKSDGIGSEGDRK